MRLLRIKDDSGSTIFFGTSEKFLSLEMGEEGGLVDTLILSLGLIPEFKQAFAFELADFIENLIIWLDPNDAAKALDRKYAYSFGSDAIESTKAGKSYVFRSVGVVSALSSENMSEADIDELILSADFDELSGIDVSFLIA